METAKHFVSHLAIYDVDQSYLQGNIWYNIALEVVLIHIIGRMQNTGYIIIIIALHVVFTVNYYTGTWPSVQTETPCILAVLLQHAQWGYTNQLT